MTRTLEDYYAMLEAKHITIKPSGFTVTDEDIHPKLHKFQRHITRWSLHLGRAAIFAGVGLGKTYMQVEAARLIAEHTGGQVLILAPLGVTEQTIELAATELGVKIIYSESQEQLNDFMRVRRGEDVFEIDESNRLVITNYDRVHLFDVSRFAGVILDECFAAGTPIDCVDEAGRVYQNAIENVQVGDRIINASGVDIVSDIHRREVPYAIKVRVNGTEIITSPNHPFFTQRGWVAAQDLEPQDVLISVHAAMRMVREEIHDQSFMAADETFLRSILLSEMADEPTRVCCESSYPGSGCETWGKEISLVQIRQSESRDRIKPHSQSQTDEQSQDTRQGFIPIENHEPQTFRAWGQWNGNDRTAIEAAGCTWEQLAGGIQFITGETSSRVSHALQARFSERRAQSMYRSGWSLTSQSQNTGCKERPEASFYGVEGIEVLELGHPELDRFRDADGKLYFYDLGGTRHPSFAVAGMLVHNSSILKHYTKTFFNLTELFENTPYRLCYSATPAPNDFVEFGNHAMFLGIMHFKDMLARWFVGEGDVARKARLAHHGREDFWRWLTSWAVCISHPRDLGPEYDMPGYDLPTMHVHDHRMGVSQETIERAWANGKLLPDDSPSATGFMKVKREVLPQRVEKICEIVNTLPPDEPVIIWCDTDFEADAVLKAFPDALEVRGSHHRDMKRKRLNDFSTGKNRMIITKPEIAGFGLNWQHCNQMILPPSFSFERTYQAIGRIHRYGQARETHIHMVYSDSEGNVMALLNEKQAAFDEMQEEMNAAMRKYGLFREGHRPIFSETETGKEAGKDWTYHLGDCVEVMFGLPDDSVDLTITSIPFGNLYIYSDKAADVGNAADKAEFLAHMDFVIEQNLRITRPGRCCAVHVKDLPLFQNRDGVMGIDPFSDDISAAYRRAGWVLQSRVTVEKDPVVEMEKTNSHGLLFKNWRERAEILRTGLPDYVLIFQKPGGDTEHRVTHDPLDITYYGDSEIAEYRYPKYPKRGTNGRVDKALPIWQEYANPNWTDVTVPLVWSDINQMDVLNYLVAKADKDERHICPLQLGLIGRLIQWKSNPGDVIFDPFGGIASTGVKALEMHRKFVGAELKPEYHKIGVKYLNDKAFELAQPTLFDALAEATGD